MYLEVRTFLFSGGPELV